MSLYKYSLIPSLLRKQAASVFAAIIVIAGLWNVAAQPTIVSTVPANGATGVSTSAPVVFTFSEAMDESQTSAQLFYLAGGFNPVNVPFNPVWNAGSNILSCTPSPGFPPLTNIYWSVDGANLAGDPLSGNTGGFFTTGSGGGGGGGGSGTNAHTTCVVGKIWFYDQTSSGASTLDTNTPYLFNALTSLSSNRTANFITVTLPTSAVSNLTQNPIYHEDYYLSSFNTNLTTFNSTFPAGNYVFNISAASSNQQVTVNLPASFTQPNAPHVTNYAAAQSINASQAFTLGWDAFTGGGTTDYVFVVIGGVWQTGGFGQTNALNGTARGVTIPANTLQAGSNYDATVGFYHATINTNADPYTEAYVGTLTEFTINTMGSTTALPVITNTVWSGGRFGFDVKTVASQTVTIVSSTNLSAGSSTWPVLLTTNSPGALFHVSDPRSSTNKFFFYRARNGS